MFYSQFILAKKGPLGTIWIAAHLERKLRKNQVAETNIGVSVDSILFPEVPIALRLSGHLLLGVVRIYSRKVNYLFHDCSEALVKIKQAFHSTIVDLPPEAATAPFHSITLPETFDFDELELLQDSESFVQYNGNFVDHHVTTREQITLQDPMEDTGYLGSSQFGLDERFVDGDSSTMGLDFDEDFFAEKLHSTVASPSLPILKSDSPSKAGPGDEGCQMDIDDPHENLMPVFGLDKTGTDEHRAAFVLGERIERDEQQNMSTLASLLEPLDEPTKDRVSGKNPLSFLPDDTAPHFNAQVPHTPQVLEARTPDLNQEFCPPDEPSTPALPAETSSSIMKDFPLASGIQDIALPGTVGCFERSRSNEQFPISLVSNQVSALLPLDQSKLEFAVPAQFSLTKSDQHFSSFAGSVQESTTAHNQQIDMASQPQSIFKGTRHNVASSFYTQRSGIHSAQQASSVEATRDDVSAPFQGFPLPASLQHAIPMSYQNCSLGSSNATDSHYSMGSLHQQFSSSSATLNHFLSSSMSNHDICAVSQQSGLLMNQRTSPCMPTDNEHVFTSPTGTVEYSSVFQPHPMMVDQQQDMVDFRGKTASSMPMAGALPSSLSPMSNLSGFSVPQQPGMLNQNSRSPMSTDSVASLRNALACSTGIVESSSVFQPHSLMLDEQVNMIDSLQKCMPSNNILSSSSSKSSHGVFPAFQRPGMLVNQKTTLPMSTSNMDSLQHALESSTGTGESYSVFQLHNMMLDQQVSSNNHLQKDEPSMSMTNSVPSSLCSNHEVFTAFQQPRMLLNQSTLPVVSNTGSLHHAQASSTGTVESSSVFQARSIPMFDQQLKVSSSVQKTVPSMPMTNNLFSTLKSSGSFSAQEELSMLAETGKIMSIDTHQPRKNEEHVAKEPTVTNQNFPAAAAQYPIATPAASLPFSLPSVSMREDDQRQAQMHVSECETLRSTVETVQEEPGFLLLRKDLTNEKMPRDSTHAAKIKEKIQPSLVRTPTLQEETPFTACKPSPFSTHSVDSIPRDDDVLATILGRGSSAFRVIPTPDEKPVPKHTRTIPRANPKKRKIVFDTLTVLHGDIIRQQLANTEDIRRGRKRAPCSQREIWDFNKEIQGQHTFFEPLLPGISTGLHDLYRTIFDENGTHISSADSHHDAKDHVVNEPASNRMDIENKAKDSTELIVEVSKEHSSSIGVSEALVTDGMVLLDDTVACEQRVDNTATEILKGSSSTLYNEDLCPQSQDAAETLNTDGVQEQCIIPQVEVLDLPPVESLQVHASQGTSQGSEGINLNQLRFTGESNGEDVEQKAAEEAAVEKDLGQQLLDPVICNYVEVENESVSLEVKNEERASKGERSGIETQIQVNFSEIRPVIDCQADSADLEPSSVAILNKHVGPESLNKTSDTDDHELDMAIVHNTNVDGQIVNHDKKLVVTDVLDEKLDANKDDQELGFVADARDTEFLAVDDDMDYYEVNDFEDDTSDDGHASSIQENSGWSTRTRNVGRYLKTIFEGMENVSRSSEEQGLKNLGLDRLLIGKTKKEAARMFFETLVLTTKEYIHVEQQNPFEDIHLCCRPKLMKTIF